ncbi:MAG: hypothetical protein NC222_07920 [Staphylococcus sp.]|nr:hypothetical protein [Staphylococcus sp.]
MVYNNKENRYRYKLLIGRVDYWATFRENLSETESKFKNGDNGSSPRRGPKKARSSSVNRYRGEIMNISRIKVVPRHAFVLYEEEGIFYFEGGNV